MTVPNVNTGHGATPMRVMITGAASGIGRETARRLAAEGHRIIVADRNIEAGQVLTREITASGGDAVFQALDLGELARIHSFASEELARNEPLDVLINNAGLLPPVARATTRDGFERGFGVAYLGHFALTALLMPALRASQHPRVVSVSSLSHANGRINFEDLQLEHGYSWSKAYEASKLACLIFALELNRRTRLAGGRLLSVAAHPGISRTPIGLNQEKSAGRTLRDRSDALAFKIAMRFLGQTAAEGAIPLIHAATSPAVKGGEYFGPTGFLQARGPTGEVQPAKSALNAETASKLWEVSERLSGIAFPEMI